MLKNNQIFLKLPLIQFSVKCHVPEDYSQGKMWNFHPAEEKLFKLSELLKYGIFPCLSFFYSLIK